MNESTGTSRPPSTAEAAAVTDAPPDRREELLVALDEVPPLGPVALRVLELMNDPNASAADLARVISRDQGLSAKLLRTCNSSFVAPTEPVTSLSQAVVTLGLRAVRNLVLFHAIPVGRAGGAWSAVERRMWTHAVGSALGSRLLAMEKGGVDPELAFLGGLFHDLGRILLLQVRPMTYEALCAAAAPGLPECRVEQESLGADHAEIGGEILRRWGMGDELAAVAASHHLPPESLGPLTLIVVAAECLLEDGDEGSAASHLAAAARFGLLPDRQEGLRERLRGALQKEQEFFHLST
jgi:putative nucleotidyltransferase with HDIG domain